MADESPPQCSASRPERLVGIPSKTVDSGYLAVYVAAVYQQSRRNLGTRFRTQGDLGNRES